MPLFTCTVVTKFPPLITYSQVSHVYSPYFLQAIYSGPTVHNTQCLLLSKYWNREFEFCARDYCASVVFNVLYVTPSNDDITG